jgi:hypothetical protein
VCVIKPLISDRIDVVLAVEGQLVVSAGSPARRASVLA